MSPVARLPTRYERQLTVPGFGPRAQERLHRARIVVCGLGPLGSAAAQYLAAAGVGTLGLVEADAVALGDLAAEPLHFKPDVGTPKAEAAATKLGLVNPELLAEPYPVAPTSENAEAIVASFDLVVDASGDRGARYLLNATCVAAGIPLVSAGACGMSAHVMSVEPGKSACLSCAFGRDLPEGGPVLGPIAGIAGSIQAMDAIALTGGLARRPGGEVIHIDGARMRMHAVPASRRPACEGCGQGTP